MAVKDQSETVNWETGKVFSEKDETKQPDQPMAPTNCDRARQLPSGQGVNASQTDDETHQTDMEQAL